MSKLEEVGRNADYRTYKLTLGTGMATEMRHYSCGSVSCGGCGHRKRIRLEDVHGDDCSFIKEFPQLIENLPRKTKWTRF